MSKNHSCRLPATEALANILKPKEHVIGKEKPMILPTAMKRSRKSFESSSSFDLSLFEEARRELEESVSFPVIEWSFNDDDDDEETHTPPTKRFCRGLQRVAESFDLSSFASCERRGSTGSLC